MFLSCRSQAHAARMALIRRELDLLLAQVREAETDASAPESTTASTKRKPLFVESSATEQTALSPYVGSLVRSCTRGTWHTQVPTPGSGAQVTFLPPLRSVLRLTTRVTMAACLGSGQAASPDLKLTQVESVAECSSSSLSLSCRGAIGFDVSNIALGFATGTSRATAHVEPSHHWSSRDSSHSRSSCAVGSSKSSLSAPA